MFSFRLLPLFFAIASIGWSPSVAQDAAAESGAVSGTVRVSRGLVKQKLCYKYGLCQGGGVQGGYQGGYVQGGYVQQGYPAQVPPINIAISQSQSSANEAGGGYSNGYYPNNYQYNFPHGFPFKGGYGGYQKPGYFNNGQGSYNSQFNGNIYAPGGHGGGYGFQGPIGPFFDENPDEEGSGPERNDDNPVTGPQGYNNDYKQGQLNNGARNFAVAGSFAAAGGRN
ncbi:pupal cuticle protein Edg-91-like [Galleria mellonella]|uniref:Pupal cuticle protein Edg-91-like n=1 Tax=Galleria mellonella TaxID=7137 RepID=A0A6J3C6P5_GALME|nr:pupal cuticle protein Edg-91-like [Galleria mellonella]